MKIYRLLLLAVVFIATSSTGFSQGKTDSVSIFIKQGIELGNQKEYSGAVAKYKAALSLQPENAQANYQMAFVLFSSGRSADAVTYIHNAIKGSTDSKFAAAAYSLQGSIYGNLNRSEESIAAYKNAIAADSSNQRIYYNLGIAYFKAKEYAAAEQQFADALKRDIKDAGSARMYALATFHQNKRTEAILGFCYFLSLEPTGVRSTEAFGNLQNILQGGALKPERGYKAVATPYITYQNGLIVKALSVFKTRKYASQADLLAAQLDAVITKLAAAPRDKHYFWHSLADHFGKVNAAVHMPAFARYISQEALTESARWIATNAPKVASLNTWLAGNHPSI
ncbi:tetratricopeptide repeat protein [Mucilaginibacter terrenus]|uniref:Tetratricopeptide repeat protein n=1 Tax=Mucilaginibacter terrenus TaxID=2482727 RepID=A0A3E2NPX1_9SPHI|nr:tetratricopeptide repeat protein [Mucilaginibacter terrenus]RFZ83027.1 tetratricopeptide repeat protein [Mucilaginibacter terrenus]